MAQPQPAKRSPRKGKRIDPVSELSCFLTVKPGREQLIREVLDAPPDQQQELINAVKDVGTLHNARYVLFDNDRRLIDHRDAAEAGVAVLTDPALWDAHHDLTGPVSMSWPEALELLSAELGEPVRFRVVAERQFLQRLIGAGVPAGAAELLIAREWAILAGENDYTTDTFQQITGHPPRPVAEFLHEHRAEFI
jgi:uncharacterized protein YbjT (DUF2867 family)